MKTEHLRRLAAMNLPAEAYQAVLEMFAEIQSAEETRRIKNAERMRIVRAQFSHACAHNTSSLSSLESKKDSTKEERKKENAVRAQLSHNEEFDAFWKLYPNKVGKSDAFRSFVGARKLVPFDQLMEGLQRYVHKTDDRPWCNPATWLNQSRWEDQPAVGGNGNGRRAGSVLEAADRVLAEAEKHGIGGYVPGSSGPQPLKLDSFGLPVGPKLVSSR